MPLRAKKKTDQESITLDKIRSSINLEIKNGKGMSIAEFAKEYSAKVGAKPASIESCLSSGAVSFPIMRKIYSQLGLGTLTKRRVVKVDYFVDK
jgi:dTDP-4-dehydrorhamnose reductase